MSSEDPLAVGVLLAEPHSSHTRSFEAEVESSDAAEKRSDIHAASPRFSRYAPAHATPSASASSCVSG